MEFNRTSLRALREEIKVALTEVLEKNSISIEDSGVSFSSNSATFKMTFRALEKGRRTYQTYEHAIANGAAHLAGFKVAGDLLGSVWLSGVDRITVIEYVPKRPKYCLTIEKESGERFRCNFTYLSHAFQIVSEVSFEDFALWLHNDYDADWFSGTQMDTYDKVDHWVPEQLGDVDSDTFYDMLNASVFNPEELYDCLKNKTVDKLIKKTKYTKK